MKTVKPPKLPKEVFEHMNRIYTEKADIYDGLSKAQDYNKDVIKILFKTVGFGGKTVLDLGTGTGKLAIPLSRKAKKVYALDKSNFMLQILRKKIKSQKIKNIKTIRGEFNESGLKKESVDIIVSLWAFPFHSADWERDLKSIRRILKKNGKIILIDSIRTGESHKISAKIHDKKHENMFQEFNDKLHNWLKQKGFKRKKIIDIASDYRTKKNVEKYCAPFFGYEFTTYLLARNRKSYRTKLAMLIGEK